MSTAHVYLYVWMRERTGDEDGDQVYEIDLPRSGCEVIVPELDEPCHRHGT